MTGADEQRRRFEEWAKAQSVLSGDYGHAPRKIAWIAWQAANKHLSSPPSHGTAGIGAGAENTAGVVHSPANADAPRITSSQLEEIARRIAELGIHRVNCFVTTGAILQILTSELLGEKGGAN